MIHRDSGIRPVLPCCYLSSVCSRYLRSIRGARIAHHLQQFLCNALYANTGPVFLIFVWIFVWDCNLYAMQEIRKPAVSRSERKNKYRETFESEPLSSNSRSRGRARDSFIFPRFRGRAGWERADRVQGGPAALLVIPALVGRAAAKNFPTDSLERQLFSGNLDRGIRLEAPNYRGTQYLGNFCEETRSRGVTRFEGIAFERRRKYRFPKAVLRFPLARPSRPPAADPIPPSEWRGFYLTA